MVLSAVKKIYWPIYVIPTLTCKGILEERLKCVMAKAFFMKAHKIRIYLKTRIDCSAMFEKDPTAKRLRENASCLRKNKTKQK